MSGTLSFVFVFKGNLDSLKIRVWDLGAGTLPTTVSKWRGHKHGKKTLDQDPKYEPSRHPEPPLESSEGQEPHLGLFPSVTQASSTVPWHTAGTALMPVKLAK